MEDNSDGSYEGFSMDDSSEEPFGIFLDYTHEEELSNASMRGREKREDIPPLNQEVAHITKLSTAPNGMLSRVYGKNQKGCISTISMLAGREANVSGRGKFSAADRCHVASRYMPTGGPVQVD
ncbi:hypothetical protein SUGI_0888520 [Cryptomeria japonica]|nr:hypothetical protein SUGI_0888520 [Cryptomeria japonica]